jgi:tol-pal system protein YbgF
MKIMPFAGIPAVLLAAASWLALAPSAPAQESGGKRGKKIMNWATQEDVAKLQEEVWKLNKGQAELKEQIAQLAAAVRDTSGGDTQASARLSAKLDEILQEMLVLSEKLSDANYRLALGARGGAPAPSASDGGAPVPASAPSPAGVDGGYQAAYADYTKGNYPLAVMGFEEFMKQNPSHALAGNALYWIGECHYAQRAFDRAIESFERVQKEYPQNDKVPAALLKQGYAYIETYQMAKGVVALQGLIEKYPHSPEAKLAKQKLKEMGL